MGCHVISHEYTQQALKQDIRIEYIQSGKPQQNAYIERANRTIRHSWVSKYLFETIEQVQDYICGQGFMLPILDIGGQGFMLPILRMLSIVFTATNAVVACHLSQQENLGADYIDL